MVPMLRERYLAERNARIVGMLTGGNRDKQSSQPQKKSLWFKLLETDGLGSRERKAFLTCELIRIGSEGEHLDYD